MFDQGGLQAFWEEFMADAEATAAEYEDAGWETILIHTGDVTPLDGDEFGLSVLAPGNEFDAVSEAVAAEGAAFDESEVFRAVRDDIVYLVVVAEDHDRELAVVVPAFYRRGEAAELLRQATEAGEMRTHVRPLSNDDRVTFLHDDPEPFLADEGSEERTDETDEDES